MACHPQQHLITPFFTSSVFFFFCGSEGKEDNHGQAVIHLEESGNVVGVEVMNG